MQEVPGPTPGEPTRFMDRYQIILHPSQNPSKIGDSLSVDGKHCWMSNADTDAELLTERITFILLCVTAFISIVGFAGAEYMSSILIKMKK